MQGVNAPNSLFETGAGQFAVAPGSLIYALGGISPSLECSGYGSIEQEPQKESRPCQPAHICSPAYRPMERESR